VLVPEGLREFDDGESARALLALVGQIAWAVELNLLPHVHSCLDQLLCDTEL
jgi:hypothetical protein